MTTKTKTKKRTTTTPPMTVVRGVNVYQERDNRIHYIADLSVDVDGSKHSYRLDNSFRLGALDDIHASAGWPNSEWWNVLVRDPKKFSPFVDKDGFCVSQTSYQRKGFELLDRRRYLDAEAIPYSVPPGRVRRLCRGVLLGCRARITNTQTGAKIECVTGDFSGNSIGEASDFAAKFFDPKLSARNGDERYIYLYEFWPDQPVTIGDETFDLISA